MANTIEITRALDASAGWNHAAIFAVQSPDFPLPWPRWQREKDASMGIYTAQNLVQGETVRHSARISLWKYWFNILAGVILLVGGVAGLIWSLMAANAAWTAGAQILCAIALVAGLILLGWPLIARRSTELVITDKRLIVKHGVLSIHSIEIRFDKIETVHVNQGLLGRMLNYGDILVTGTGTTLDPIPDIADAQRFREALNQAMEPTK